MTTTDTIVVNLRPEQLKVILAEAVEKYTGKKVFVNDYEFALDKNQGDIQVFRLHCQPRNTDLHYPN